MFGVRVGDDVAVVIDYENIAAADTGVLQAVQDGVQRDYRGQHAAEIVIDIFQWDGDDECWAIVWGQGQGVAAKFGDLRLLRLQAGDEGTLQGFGDEGILLGAEIALRSAGAFTGFAYRS